MNVIVRLNNILYRTRYNYENEQQKLKREYTESLDVTPEQLEELVYNNIMVTMWRDDIIALEKVVDLLKRQSESYCNMNDMIMRAPPKPVTISHEDYRNLFTDENMHDENESEAKE
ncbi:MAG: hypothetical protein OXC46_00900 [Thaumarchaeota archaeon]|nr:hypothetical protein [Nitrososphaerota archaeon]